MVGTLESTGWRRPGSPANPLCTPLAHFLQVTHQRAPLGLGNAAKDCPQPTASLQHSEAASLGLPSPQRLPWQHGSDLGGWTDRSYQFELLLP